MTKAADPLAPRQYSPRGVDKKRRVNVSFTPNERAVLDAIATSENRTNSSAVRKLLVIGVHAAYPDLADRVEPVQ